MSIKNYIALVEGRLDEAVPLKQTKKYRRMWNPELYKDLFMGYPADERDRQGFRIYLPYEEPQTYIRVPSGITHALREKGYVVSDYAAGIAKQITGTREMKIGRLLSDQPELLKQFVNDPQRAAKKIDKKLVVISRHPHDLAGMSYDRGWTSCMNIETGMYRKYVEQDVKQGSVVAYLIRGNDRNINNPIARILIKPFRNSNGEVMLVPENNVYGTPDENFHEVVKAWCDEANSEVGNGIFKMAKTLYNDGTGRMRIKGASLNADNPEDTDRNVEEYLNSINAEPPTLLRDGHEYILEEWPNLSSACRDFGDDTLEYLIDLAEEANDLKNTVLAESDFAEILGYLPDDVLQQLCTKSGVRYAASISAGFKSMLETVIASKIDLHEAVDIINNRGDLVEKIMSRIDKYVECGWYFVIDACYLEVPKKGDHCDLDAKVQLRIRVDDMVNLIENHVEDPDNENGGNGNDELYRLVNRPEYWSSLDENRAVSEWRGEYSHNEKLVDRQGHDLIFGSKRSPKFGVTNDDFEVIAATLAAYYRGDHPRLIPDDRQAAMAFEGRVPSIRKLLNLLRG